MALVLSLQVTQMLLEYLGSFEVAPVFTEEEVLHYLMPVDGVIETHVVEGRGEPCRHCFHAGYLPAAQLIVILSASLEKPVAWQAYCCTCKTRALEVLQRVLLLLVPQSPGPCRSRESKGCWQARH